MSPAGFTSVSDERSRGDAPILGWGVVAAFAAIAALIAIDLATDLAAGTSVTHAAFEATAAALGAVAAIAVARRLRARARSAEDAVAVLSRDVAVAEANAARWRAEAAELSRGLGDAIDRQLAAWGLTPAEAEVARLLLKGLSHKEIAAVRAGSEATARQQATTVYRKAGLAGRAELAAFFLEDLLAPRSPVTEPPDPR
ncbi:MAG: helix-turn-helix transcriptional regulator [Kofleriaceae bacterium]|jgi:DNA-binding CsgD family transcriptional regulator|nr:helix-turn-helix transcriptional regulator [Kofleriaceae bacterium]MBP9170887.1 helix-turn-helix transcriptional regulator [Kofleriaceae bacterium]MBP9861286.1 helix-turn-helix transcriptional regulator [Kofleriaceae bacterium]